MQEPAINSYETFLDAEARDEIGAVNLKEKGTVIAFRVSEWTADNLSTNETTKTQNAQIPPEYGHVGAFSNINGERTELELVDCRSVLTEKEFSFSEQFFQDGVTEGSVSCVDLSNV